MAMTLVATSTVTGASAASIEFANIPATGKDLLCLISVRDGGGSVSVRNLLWTLNGTSANYNTRQIYGDAFGSVGASGNLTSSLFTTNTAKVIPGSTSTANSFSNCSLYIASYTSSLSKRLSFDGGGGQQNPTHLTMLAGRWENTSAITSLKLEADGNFAQYSTASLYIIS